jgi:hypothetical protein
MIKHNRGSNSYYKAQITEFTHYIELPSPQEIGNEKIDENYIGGNQTIRFFQIEQNRKNEPGLQVLIDLSPPLSLSTKKMSGRSSRGFTRCLHLVLHSLHLQHHECELEEGNQMKEGEMRMPRPRHHSQSQNH